MKPLLDMATLAIKSLYGNVNKLILKLLKANKDPKQLRKYHSSRGTFDRILFLLLSIP